MQEAVYENNIFISKLQPIISQIQEQLVKTCLIATPFEEMLRKIWGYHHPYCLVMSNICKRQNGLLETLRFYLKEPDMPTDEKARKRFIKEARNGFYQDLMQELELTPQEISTVTNTPVSFLEKIRTGQN